MLRSPHFKFIELVTLFNVLWIIVVLILLSHIVYNGVKYLIRQGRLKEFHITFFYLLATIVLTLRMTQFFMTILYYHTHVGGEFSVKIAGVGILSSFIEGTIGLQ